MVRWGHYQPPRYCIEGFNGQTQLCNQATHLNTEGMQESLLDLIFFNVPDLFPPPWMLCRQTAHWTIYQLLCIVLKTTILPNRTLLGMLQRWRRKHNGISIWKTRRKCLMHSSLTTGHMYLSSIMTWMRLGGAGKSNSWRMSNPSFLLDLLLPKPV